MWVIYAIGSAFFAALVAIFGKLGLKDMDSTLAATIKTIVMAILLFLTALMFGKFKGIQFSAFGSKAWFYIILSGIAGAVSYIFYFYALKYGPTTAVASIDKTSIVLVAILAALFLGEGMNAYKIIGVTFVALGAFLTILK